MGDDIGMVGSSVVGGPFFIRFSWAAQLAAQLAGRGSKIE
jgi:hypothetical protein